MSLPKVGFMTFGDPRKHEWTTVFSKLAIPRHEKAIKFLSELPIELVYLPEVACTKEQIKNQTKCLKDQGVEAFIAHNPCWAWPNTIVYGVQEMDMPTVLLSNNHPGTHGTVGLLGAGGALNQIGKKHIRIRAEFSEEEKDIFINKMVPYLRAASTINKIKGSTFGMFGGRSLGIDTGSYDPMQWKKLFKIDCDHIDQLEIIRVADTIDENRANKFFEWLTSNVKCVKYNEKLTKEKLLYQIKCYLATKDIIEEKNLDFISIKCMPDLTNHYIPQCLSAALLPGLSDIEGKKKSIAMACEADADAALTMQMLKYISNESATFFADVSHLNPKKSLVYLPNCGGMCNWFAKRSESVEENLREIELRAANRPAGGSITYFVPSEGDVTMARLYRINGEYEMAILYGNMITPDKETSEEFIKARGVHQLPTAFINVDMDYEKFIDEFNSNHIVGVAGNYVDELLKICEILNIKSKVMSKY